MSKTKTKKKSVKEKHPYKTGFETENKIIKVDRYLYDKNESSFTEFECFKEIPVQFPKAKFIYNQAKKILFVFLERELLVYTKVK